MSARRTPGHRPVSTPAAMLVALIALVALLASACSGDDVGAADPAVSAGVAPIAGGGQIDFGDLEGSPAMLWFWAPW